MTNVRVAEGEEGEVAVKSNLLLYRSRQRPDRRCALRRAQRRVAQTRRRVEAEKTRDPARPPVVMTHNLSVFF